MTAAKPKPRRIWRQIFYCVGGVLAFSAFAGWQAFYFAEYLRSGDSMYITLVYQQPMLRSSALVIGVFIDILLIVYGVVAILRWRQSRE
jgi:hypothetical protein